MSSTAATTPAPAVAPPPMAAKIDDFSDKLSPMLVKELRQGLRAKTFVILFLALQGMLTFVLLIAMGAASSSESGHVVSSVIFFFFSIAVLVVQPLRGIGTLHNEIRGSTIDLMVLTRMGTWRIVLGKWVAIVSQSALLLAAIAPYLILRYFFGRMELFAELLLMMLVFLGSAVFTAVTVGLSALPSILVRGLLPLLIAVYLGAVTIGIIFDGGLPRLIDFCTLNSHGSGLALLAGVVAAIYGGWSALALGASAIAPMAENHSSIRRIVSLGAVLVVGMVGYFGNFERETTGPLLVLFAAPAVAIALTEPMNLLPPIVRPFLRFGGMGKLAGRILYPGWASGTIYTGILLLVAIGCVLIGQSSPSDGRLNIFLISALGTLLFPAVVLRIFSAKVKNPLAFYLLILAITVAITIGVLIGTIESDEDQWVWFLSWIPPVQIVLGQVVSEDFYRNASGGSATGGVPDFRTIYNIGVATAGVCYALLVASAFKNFFRIREVEDEALASPDTTVPEATRTSLKQP